MIIYKTTNLINGKFYIGKDEKNNSKYLGSGKILKSTIKKYGLENFKKEVIEICTNRKQLNDREKYWIQQLSATTLGYNITEGGTGGGITKHNKIYQLTKDGVLVKEWCSVSEINKCLNIDSSTILKACKGKLLSVKGFVWSFNNKPSLFLDTRTIKVLQYNKKGLFIKEWNSIVEIKKEYKIGDRHIQSVLDTPCKTAKGFIWVRKKGEIKDKIEVPKSGYFKNKNAKKNKL